MISGTRRFDAVIVGAGPAGSTAAILLAQAGWSVALIEKQAFPRRKVCGECIAATNLPLLHALGIGARFDAIAGPELRDVALLAGNTILQAPLPANDGSHPWGRALGREHLDALLLARAAAAGATVLQPCTVRRIVRDAAMHVCEAVGSDSATMALAAPVLIAAHGSWEPDPSREEKHVAHHASDLFAFKANFRNATLAPGLLPVLAFPGGYGGIVLGDHERTTLAFCIRRDALQAARKRHPARKAALSALAHVVEQCAGVGEILRGAELEAPWLGVGPIRPGIRKPWRDDGVFAIGNVAGEAHPILGEGMSMAIQSAWLLCDRLAACGDELRGDGFSAAALAGVGGDYAKAWRRSFASRIRLASVFAHLAMRPGASAALLPLLRRWPGLLTAGARAGSKVRSVVAIARTVRSEA
jgi:2-polyprenyl-6-methoxyphenol hydroxylase-like FAD-dependent oxidoreductase